MPLPEQLEYEMTAQDRAAVDQGLDAYRGLAGALFRLLTWVSFLGGVLTHLVLMDGPHRTLDWIAVTLWIWGLMMNTGRPNALLRRRWLVVAWTGWAVQSMVLRVVAPHWGGGYKGFEMALIGLLLVPTLKLEWGWARGYHAPRPTRLSFEPDAVVCSEAGRTTRIPWGEATLYDLGLGLGLGGPRGAFCFLPARVLRPTGYFEARDSLAARVGKVA